MLYRTYIAFILALLFSTSAFADVNVVMLVPQGGRYKTIGNELFEGARIAADNINQSGGLRGQRVNVITVDDKCNDDAAIVTAQNIAEKKGDDKVSLIIGPYCPNSFDKITEIYAKAGIFQIIPTAMGTKSIKQNYKGLVKLVGSKERQGRDFFTFCQENFSDRMVAIVYDSNDRDVVEIAATIQSAFVKEKISDKLKSFDYNKYEDIDDLADAVFDSGSRVAYVLGDPKKVTKIFRALKLKNENFVVFASKYQISDDYSHKLGDLADDSYFISLPSLKDNPAFTEELVKLRLLGVEPEGLSVYSYTALKLWESLVNRAKSFDYDKLAAKLKNNTFSTPWGPAVFHEGSPKENINYCIYKIKPDHLEKVY